VGLGDPQPRRGSAAGDQRRHRQATFDIFGYGFFIDNLDISAAVIAAILVAG
jgi:hypothetical protein